LKEVFFLAHNFNDDAIHRKLTGKKEVNQ